MRSDRVVEAPKPCRGCGTEMTRKTFNGRLEDLGVFKRRQFCGRPCQRAHAQRPTIKPKSYHWRARRYRESACSDCGATERLQVHHLDGNPANNIRGNLMTLCISCHTKWHWRNGKREQLTRTTR